MTENIVSFIITNENYKEYSLLKNVIPLLHELHPDFIIKTLINKYTFELLIDVGGYYSLLINKEDESEGRYGEEFVFWSYSEDHKGTSRYWVDSIYCSSINSEYDLLRYTEKVIKEYFSKQEHIISFP